MTWTLDLNETQRKSLIVGGCGAAKVLGEHAAEMASRGRRLFVLTDRNVMGLWGPHIIGLLGEAAGSSGVKVLAPGEATKSVGHAEGCWQWLASVGARRDDTIVALGGGVVGDLAGFVAATYLRGIDLWQIPTTLLAQVDSSVGGKVGVNLPAGKNLVGSFYQPGLVIIDPAFLSTLSRSEVLNGLGEVLKYGLLAGNTLLDKLEGAANNMSGMESDVWSLVVRECVEYKARVVSEDETERGGRVVLNLGHTTAHALEKALGYGEIAHGEAVGLGLLVALALSEEKLGLSASLRERVARLMVRVGMATRRVLPATDELVVAARHDKKITASSTGFVLLEAAGRPAYGVNVHSREFERALGVIRV